MAHKKLQRSTHKIVGGVLAGFAEYFDHDPLLWRIGFIIFLIATGLMPGVLIYVLAWMFIPSNTSTPYTDVNEKM